MSTIKIKLANVNSGGAYTPYPQSIPTITSQAISDLSKYSDTVTVLQFDATTYANATNYTVNYVTNQNFVNTSQLSANLSNYQTLDGLSANVVLLTANAAGYLGNSSGTIANIAFWITGNAATTYANAAAYVDGKSFVNTSTLNTTLSAYQLTANLGLAVSTLQANSASYLGNSSGTLATIQNYITTNASAAYTNAVSYVDSKPFVNTSQLSANLSNYQTTAGMLSNVAVLTSNAAGYLSNSSGTLVNITNWITGNAATAYSNAVSSAAALYQTTTGLPGTVATLTANAAGYLGNSSGTIANVASWITGNAATAYTNATLYVTAQSFVNTNQLSSNLSNYQTTAGLPGTVATLTANAAGYLGNSSGTIANVASWITGNAATAYANATSYADSKAATAYSNAVSSAAALYQTTTGLPGTVATLTANAAGYLGNSSGTIANVASWITGNAATAYTNATSYVTAQSFVNTSQLSSNLANYATLSGAVFTGQVNVTTFNTSGNASIGGALTITGNLTVGGNVTVIGANNLSIVDNMIYLNSSSATANPDLGFAANYNDGTYHHAGFFRDHSSGTWKVFDNYLPEPDASPYIDQTNSTFHIANFQANTLYIGNNSVYATVNTTNFTGTANNANNLGGIAAASYVNSSQLSANLSNYQTTTGLSGTVATLQANSASYLGNSSGTIANVASWITGNAATAYTNATSYADSKAATAYTNATSFASNASNITTGTLAWARAPSGTVNTSGSFTITGMYTYSNGITISNTVTANGSNGTAGYVLTSAGPTGNAYWSSAGFVNGQSISVNNFVMTGALSANGSNGSAGQVLLTNGSIAYWGPAPTGGGGTVTQINTGSGLTGGPITTTGTVSVLANSGVVANSTGLFVDSSYIATLSANNATYFNGTSLLTINNAITGNAATAYTNAVNYVTAQSFVNTSQLSANLSNYQTISGLAAAVLPLTANNTSYLGGIAAASYVNSSQLSANLSNYQTISGLAAAVLPLTANNASYLGGTAAASYVNTSGAYTISGAHTYSANVTLNNNIDLNFKALSGANVSMIQQNDDNFVFYSTNTIGGQRAIWSVFANSITSSFSLSVPTTLNANLTLGSSGLSVNGSFGTSGQVLTSNGTAAYWSSVAATGVNTAAQYTWTNTHTFNANVSFGAQIGLTTNTGALYLNGTTDANWRIGRNIGVTSKFYYTNNTLDFVVANSNLEGISFGFTGNSYLETGYAGTFTRLPIYVGNSSVNVSINSTSFTGTANNASYLGGVAAASYVNTSGSYTLSGTITHSGNTIFTNWVNLKTYIENASSPAISASALTLDLSNTTVFTVNLNSNITTLTISNAPATTNAVSGFVVIFTADGTARSVTWPSTTPNVRWANGTAPTLTSTNNKRDVLTFFTTDNGSTYNAFISGQNL